jgi:hypothetical protein
MMPQLRLSRKQKKSVVLVDLVEMQGLLLIVQQEQEPEQAQALVALQEPMPHQLMEAINPLKLRMPLKPPSSASVR